MPGLSQFTSTALLDLLPTPARLFFDTLAKGDRSDITEANFTPEELDAIRQLVGNSMSAGKEGGISYPDYDAMEQPGLAGLLTPKGRVANSLGQFQYAKDPEGITVTDAYDFNPMFKNESALLNTVGGIGTGGFTAGHLLGEYVVPPGKGRNVKIRLPNR